MTRLLPFFAAAFLTACDPVSFQTTSGADYVAARAQSETEPEIRRLAAVEPHLAFPARIGVARVMYGDLTVAPAAEARLLQDLLARTKGFGEFVPLIPIAAELAGGNIYRFDIEDARRLGARQHLDYILFYDVSGASGAAQAVFVDVRNGYPYATAQAAVAGAERKGFWGGEVRNPARRDAMALTLARALIPEVEAMLTGLARRAGIRP